MSEKPVKDMTFEEAMGALEDVVRQLESGEVDLEKSIALYERGADLKAHCENKLRTAEEKVELITKNDRGEPTGTQPLDPD
jgi:exodeoxyribonuclease VII small subunit